MGALRFHEFGDLSHLRVEELAEPPPARFEPVLSTLAHDGRQIAITSVGPGRVSLDLRDFYHRRLTLMGVEHRQAIEEALPPIQLHQPREEREDGKSAS